MALSDDFQAAQVTVKQLKRSPNTDELLQLYSLYKQASEGDVRGERPGMLDFKARAKYDAWTSRKGMTQEAAMSAYVALVSSLVKQYS
ncbi:MAG TPA: acyl-CoA-binding protein [Polyangiaceae bacterium]|nr:acyl-CoA-binding protein [Polyangiaceae bacterium]